MSRLSRVVLIASLGAVLCPSLLAQVSPEEHAKHHPKGGDEAAQDSSREGGMGGMMGEGMEGMMSSMGVPPPKELYPSLMDLPDLPLEQRAEVQEQAHERMKDGAAVLSSALERLSQAAPGDDFAAMQDALGEVREGLARFESGLAAHRALAEGSAPRNVALQWFKREMNLLPPAPASVSTGPLGLSWFHFYSMVVLIAFAVVMIWMYFHKMRRASALLESLASASPAGGADTATHASVAAPPQSNPIPSSAPPANATAHDDPSVDASCCDTTVEPCPSEAAASGSVGAPTGLLAIGKRKLCRLRVARIDQETPNVKTLRFVACHGGGIPFSYLPGQFLTLTLPVAEKPIRRSYTISSSPTQGYYCEITVKREEHGAGSHYLHDRVAVGDTIEVQAPSGKFYFTGEEVDSIVLIAGGVGITPMMSVTRAMTDMAWQGDIYFVVACHNPENFIFEAELERLQERHPNLHVFAAMSRIDKDIGAYRKGRLSQEFLTEWVPEIASKRVHVCGPPTMMDAVRSMLTGLGVPAENIRTENFGSEHKPRPEVEDSGRSSVDEGAAQTGSTLTFTESKKSAVFRSNETVLEAAERVDVDIAYSCRVGSCGVCTVKLLSGKVSMEVDDGLEPEDRKAGMVLACQARSDEDVSVEA